LSRGAPKMTPFFSGQTYDAGLFTPFEDLSALSEAQFTTLKHPAFPKHGVRIKKTKFCDGTVECVEGLPETRGS
jgi:cathepsin A (carboxypeptidase C)